MDITTKTKPAMHLGNQDKVVFRNETSGKIRTFSVLQVTEDEEKKNPLRVTYAIPSVIEGEKDAVSEIGYTYRENVEVLAS